MKTCRHNRVIQGTHSAYSGPVSIYEENRAAHGCVTYIETCSACGAERSVNQNQCHYEYGSWGPDREQREAAERRAAEEFAAAEDQRCRDAARASQRTVMAVRGDAALIDCAGEPRWIGLRDIRAAAAQPDNGDGLVQAYRGLLLIIRDMQRAGSEQA